MQFKVNLSDKVSGEQLVALHLGARSTVILSRLVVYIGYISSHHPPKQHPKLQQEFKPKKT